MSDLKPGVLPLDKGLDLTSPKLLAPPGSLLDCKNYEITDTMGLSRISGYEPFDAQVSPSLTSLYRIVLTATPAIVVGDIVTISDTIISTLTVEDFILVTSDGDYIVTEADISISYADSSSSGSATTASGLNRTLVLGKVVALDLTNNAFFVTVVNRDLLNAQVTIGKLNLTTAAITDLDPVLNIVAAEDYYSDADTYNTALLDSFTTLRTDITPLGYPAAGLHYFRDTLYAVAPVRQFVVVNDDGAGNQTAGNWSLSATAGTFFSNSFNSAIAYILSISSTTNPDTSIETYYIDVVEDGDWDSAISASATLVGLGFSAGTAVGATGCLVSSTQSNHSSLVGTLWYCKDAQQGLDDADVPIKLGWQPINQGYTIGFTGGTAATSSITKLERSLSTYSTSATYYLTDGTNVLSCDLVSYFISSGAFTTNDASGTLQIRNLAVVSGSLLKPDATWDIHTANPPSGANKLADLTSTFDYNSLALNPLLVQENTRYQFVSANFYSDSDWDAFYGVNGAGRAFYYDRNIFAKIFTQTDSTKDLPRHVAYHHDHLALGFKPGSLQLSVLGEPHNFSGLDGASEFGMGDRITGLMELNGDTLGVFCEQSIKGISGTTDDNFTTTVLSPNTGCIEYTLVNMGFPVYCNSSGIVTLDQSNKYGDFVGNPMSYDINSFLRPRLKRVTGRYAAQPGVIGAMPVRAKNQYRLFFKDGKVVTMTLNGTDNIPKFTMQEYAYNTSQTIIPFAWSSQTDENGEEYLHLSHYDTRTGNYSDYVYELDKGWGFAGLPMDHYFETNWFSNEAPWQFMGIQKVRVHGITRGRASLKIAASGVQNLYDSEYNETEEYLDLPRTPILFTEDGSPATNIANLANRGLAVQLKVSNRTITDPEPYHICQVLILQTKPGGKQDG